MKPHSPPRPPITRGQAFEVMAWFAVGAWRRSGTPREGQEVTWTKSGLDLTELALLGRFLEIFPERTGPPCAYDDYYRLLGTPDPERFERFLTDLRERCAEPGCGWSYGRFQKELERILADDST